jgi:hypothetical protein
MRFRASCKFPVQIFVANNGDSDFDEELCEFMNSAGVKVVERPNTIVSMSQNWLRGFDSVRQTSVSHLLVMGDDDFMLTGSRKFERALLSGADAVICDKGARRFVWPENGGSSQVEIRKNFGFAAHKRVMRDPEAMFSKPFLYTVAPGPYAGFVSVNALEKVVTEFGCLSPVRSPDVFLGFVVATIPGLKTVYLRSYFVVDGQCVKSNGASTTRTSTNDAPGNEFYSLSIREVPEPSSLPGLSTFPSLFVSTTEVFDSVRVVRPNLRPLDVEVVIRGLEKSAHRAKPEELRNLELLCAQNGLRLDPIARATQTRIDGFKFHGFSFDLEVPRLGPADAQKILGSNLQILRLLWASRKMVWKGMPSNVRSLFRKVQNRCRPLFQR